jgi:lipoprotein-releasing system permease protein
LFESFIYRRYLIAKKKFQFISLINKLSILGIAIGVSSLIVIMSIFNGFRDYTILELIRDKPHLTITDYDDSFAEYIKQDTTNIYSFKTVYINDVLLEKNRNKSNCKIMISKQYSGNIISNKIANSLDVFLGDTLKIVSLTQIESMISSFRLLKAKKFIVDDVMYDNSNLIKTNDLNLKLPGSVKEMHLVLNDFEQAIIYSDILNNKFKDITVSTWYSKNKLLLVIMNIERYFVFIVLFIIVIIASFNLFASISMTVFEKNRDIGILRTIGSNKLSIKKIFLTQGIISGVIGLSLGVIIGMSIVISQITFHWLNINVNNGMSHPLPMQFSFIDLIFIIICTLLLVYLSAFFPSKFSTKKTISESIKLNF